MINVRKFLRSKDKFSDCKSPSNRLKMMHVNLIMVRLNTNIGEKGMILKDSRGKKHLRKVKVKVAQSCLTLGDPMEFSRPEYWSGSQFSSPGDLPIPGIEPRSPSFQVDSSPAEPQGKPKNTGVGGLSLLQGIFPPSVNCSANVRELLGLHITVNAC